jgi:hypothetical protein
MQADTSGSFQEHSDRFSKSPVPAEEEERWDQRTLRFVLLVLALNVISASLFISLVHHPVYDDPNNIFDVHNYATRGLSTDTLLSHRTPQVPRGSFGGLQEFASWAATSERTRALPCW